MRKLNSRSIHRYLSIVIGIQLLFWTISGLIFSWNPIEQVRGEDLIRTKQPVNLEHTKIVSLGDLIESNEELLAGRLIERAEIRSLPSMPVYEITLRDNSDAVQQKVFEAETGKHISQFSEELAKQIALADFAEDVEVASVELITSVVAHSEYRGKELPAYRVVLDHPTGTVIYVSAERGVVTTRRNNRWRIFDFFWMLHTMDYQGRDNFNHWVLRTFSIFGVATVLSGYWLWWRTTSLRKRRGNKTK